MCSKSCTACLLEARVSGGVGSRTSLSQDKLVKAGWSVEKKGKSFVYLSPAPNGKRFKSSKDVVAYLQERREYHLYSTCSCVSATANQVTGEDESSELETEDEDYHPETEDETGVSSAYDDTPIKGERSVEAFGPMPKR